MIKLEEASKEISKIIKKHLSELEKKYTRVEHNGASIHCVKANNDTIKLQAIPDHVRRKIDVPQSSKEYQIQGGIKILVKNSNIIILKHGKLI